jgi:hypothetical protein
VEAAPQAKTYVVVIDECNGRHRLHIPRGRGILFPAEE